ncbi:MAG: hypothetical protein KJN62_05450 [Deltaproteobacteria bacterium]|nr:hypothetical protein [Deltaproteobacteria bacterium]
MQASLLLVVKRKDRPAEAVNRVPVAPRRSNQPVRVAEAVRRVPVALRKLAEAAEANQNSAGSTEPNNWSKK